MLNHEYMCNSGRQARRLRSMFTETGTANLVWASTAGTRQLAKLGKE